jgi:hypothetical protein
MAISGKEAARQIIDNLPEDATLEDIMYAMYVRQQIELGLRNIEAGDTVSHEEVMREIDKWRVSVDADVAAAPGSQASLMPGAAESDANLDAEDVTYHLEREGHIAVLVPDRPVPPLDPDIATRLLNKMYREREDRWMSPSDEGD